MMIEEDAREFGNHARQGGWRLGLLVARNVELGKDQGRRQPQSDQTEVDGSEKVSASEFAKLAQVGKQRVLDHFHAWEDAARDGLVPRAEELSPGQDIDLDPATVSLLSEGERHRRFDEATTHNERLAVMSLPSWAQYYPPEPRIPGHDYDDPDHCRCEHCQGGGWAQPIVQDTEEVRARDGHILPSRVDSTAGNPADLSDEDDDELEYEPGIDDLPDLRRLHDAQWEVRAAAKRYAQAALDLRPKIMDGWTPNETELQSDKKIIGEARGHLDMGQEALRGRLTITDDDLSRLLEG